MNAILFATLFYLAIISATLPGLFMHLKWRREQERKRQRILCGHRIVESVSSNQNPENCLNFAQLEQRLKDANFVLHTDLHGCTN